MAPVKCEWCGTIHAQGQNTLCPLTIAQWDDVKLEHGEGGSQKLLALAYGFRQAVKKLQAQRDAEAQLAALRTLAGIAGGPVALRDRILRLLEYEKEVAEAWKMIERGYGGAGMESREELELASASNGFRYGLVQAVHHMWKRDPNLQLLIDALRFYSDSVNGGVAQQALDALERP